MRASKGPKDRVVESDRKSSETYSCPPSPVRAVGVTSRASGCPVTLTDDASDVGVNVKLAATSPAMLATWLPSGAYSRTRSEEHTSELQSQSNLVCRLLLEKKKSRRSREVECEAMTS